MKTINCRSNKKDHTWRIVLIVITLVLSTAMTRAGEDPKIQVFLFAGQSNMEGRVNGDKLSAEYMARLDRVGDRISFYYNHNPVSPLRLTEASEYIKNKFNLVRSFGPELFFGIEMAENNPDQDYIFIKRSKGGTSLYGCWNPSWDEKKAAHMNEADQPGLFSDFINYVNTVLNQYNPDEYEICGMLWVQGETDSAVKKWGPLPAETYGYNLRILINKVREEFKNPGLPFVMFQVGGGKVVEAMEEIAGTDPGVYLIPQSGDPESDNFFEKNPPPLGHYVASSMKRIGEKFYEVFAEIGR